MGPKTKRGKVHKEPQPWDGIKRPLSAYFFFIADIRAKLKEEGATTGKEQPKASKVASIAGEKWQKMNDADKAPFYEMNKKDAKRYEKAMQPFKKMIEDSKKKKKGPKRGITGYLVFGQDYRANMNPSQKALTAPEKMKDIGEKWNELSDKEKDRYKQMAEKKNKETKELEAKQNAVVEQEEEDEEDDDMDDEESD